MKTVRFKVFVVGAIESKVQISDELYERVQSKDNMEADEAMDDMYDILGSHVDSLGDWTDHEIDLREFWNEIDS